MLGASVGQVFQVSVQGACSCAHGDLGDLESAIGTREDEAHEVTGGVARHDQLEFVVGRGGCCTPATQFGKKVVCYKREESRGHGRSGLW